MAVCCAQLRLLVWKNYLLKKRSALATLMEFLTPCAAVVLLLWIRYEVDIVDIEPSDNLEFAVPVAASALLSLQYLVCGAEEYSSGSSRAMFAPRGHVAVAGTSDAARQFVQSVVEPALIDAMLLAYAASTDMHAPPASLQLPPAVQSAVGRRLGAGTGTGSQRHRIVCDDRHGHPHPPHFNVSDYIRTDMVKQFASPADMDAYIQAPAYGNDDAHRGLMYGIIVSGVAPAWNYTLRTNWSALADTSWQTNDLQASLDVGDFFTFFSSGAATFQFVLDQAILAVSGVELDLANAATKFIPFPLPAHRVDPFASYVSDVFGLLFLFAYLWPFSRLVRSMVDEKETRLREGMKMMGLQNLVFWASWLLTYAALFFVVCCIFIAMSSHYLFAYTNVEILFLLFFAFAINLLFLACLCTAFFSRAKTAGTLSPFVLLLAFLPFFAVNDPAKSTAAKLFASLLSPVAFSLASKTLVEYQSGFQGITWANISELHNNTSFAQMLLMMCLDTVIYAVLAWYLDNVLPSEFGTHESPLFCLRWKYWRDGCCRRGCCDDDLGDGDNEVSDRHRPLDSKSAAHAPWASVAAGAGAFRTVIDADADADADHHALIEPVSAAVAARPGVHVRALRKQFTNDRGVPFAAVRGMDLDLHAGELCVLLGHNGAGKTTLINMLTGMCEPTSGRAWLYGREISADMSAIRRSLGVCPQHDVLFPTLTVREHLEFFLRLKESSSVGEPINSAGSGLGGNGSGSGSGSAKSAAAVQRAVEAAAAEVQLEAKLDAAAATLSGGQRRRLSLAIAFIGDSKVIFLDEPTSGVDPFSRRAIWDLLARKKRDRVVLLSTHQMDEADQLGDRIAIMHHGRLRCCGAPLFLKSRFGVGYTLTLTKPMGEQHEPSQNQDPNQGQKSHSQTRRASVSGNGRGSAGARVDEALEALVTAHVARATVLSSAGAELSFRLPIAASAEFPALLHALDAASAPSSSSTSSSSSSSSSSIVPPLLQSYGLSVTTLEEVFMRVAHEADAADDDALSSSASSSSSSVGTRELVPPLIPPRPSDAAPTLAATVADELKHHQAASSGDNGNGAAMVESESEYQVLPDVLSSVDLDDEDSAGSARGGGRRTSSSKSATFAAPSTIHEAEEEEADAEAGRRGSGAAGESHGGKKSLRQLRREELDFSLLNSERGHSTFCRQFNALLAKRWHSTKRDMKSVLCQVVLPLILLSVGMFLLRIPVDTDFHNLRLSLDVYNSPLPVPFNNYTTSAVDGSIVYAPGAFSALSALQSAPNPLIDPQSGFRIAAEPFGPSVTSEYDVSYALLATRDAYGASRYGALAFNATQSASGSGQSLLVLDAVYANVSAVHGLATYLNLGHNALLHASSSASASTIETHLHPFPWTQRERQFVQNINGAFSAISIAIAYSFIPAAVAVAIVKERESKAKHLQLLSGVGALAYWLANFVFDFVSYLIPAGLGVAIIFAFNNPTLTGDNFPVVALSFALNGLSVIPFTYVFSFLFTSHSTAQNVMIMVYLASGVVMVITTFALQQIPKTREVNEKYLRHAFRLFPNFCLSDTVFFLSARDFYKKSQWDWFISGYDLVYMGVESIVYFALTLLLERLSAAHSATGVLAALRPTDPVLADARDTEDDDVRAERERVRRIGVRSDGNGNNGSDGLRAAAAADEDELIQLHGLRKTYADPPGVAVKDLWFSVPRNQCFGFLGVNGAGKTTALRMLSGDETPSAGRASLGGLDIATHPYEVRRLIGYCPQFDALFDLLTGREHLFFYGRVRGVPAARLPLMVDALLQRLTLVEFADRAAGTYSGGNKRKLSVAIALIGNPPVVFLDEPSTGVDPVSRRFMWDFIAASMADRAVILTTHSMEECEALCARIGILVQGQLQCIGSAQRLKHRYGRGLQLDVAVAADAEDTRDVQAFVERTFIGAQLIEAYNNRLKYRVPIGGANANAANGNAANASAALGASSNAGSALRLADMFEAIEIHKAALRITDYSIGQATLEQIFIRFVRSSGSGGTGEEDTVLRAEAGDEEDEEAAQSAASASSRRLLTAAAAASPSTTDIGSLNRA